MKNISKRRVIRWRTLKKIYWSQISLKKSQRREVYNDIRKTIKIEIRQAKEKELKLKCDEIEELRPKYDSFNVRRKVREVIRNNKVRTINSQVDNKGTYQYKLN